MRRLLCVLPVLALLLSACGARDATLRADVDAIRAQLAALPGVAGVETAYDGGAGDRFFTTTLTTRPDAAEADVVAAVLRYREAWARSSLVELGGRLELVVPVPGGERRMTLSAPDFPATEAVAPEVRRWYAVAEVVPTTSLSLSSRGASLGVVVPDRDLDPATAYPRVAAVPGVDDRAASWSFSGIGYAAGRNLALYSSDRLPAPELVDAWERLLAAARPAFGDDGELSLSIGPTGLRVFMRVADGASPADHAVPERSRAWPGVTEQIRVLTEVGRPFTYEVELPFLAGTTIESDVCPDAGTAWVTAVHGYYRSLPGNRAGRC